MDPRIARLYEEELRHVREVGAEFAREFPKVAARLGMESTEVADPYVERLIEGFAFIAARIRLKLDAEFPRFTQQLLNIVFPHYLAPTPAIGVVELKPRMRDVQPDIGLVVPRGTAIRASAARGETTSCEFRTAHALTIWPLTIASARYFSVAPDLPLNRITVAAPIRSGVRIALASAIESPLAVDQCDALDLYIKAPDTVAYRLYEQIVGQTLGALVVDEGGVILEQLPAENIVATGFADDEALLPADPRTFSGFRILREYFALPQRLLFFRITGLRKAFARARGNRCEIVLLSRHADQSLEASVNADCFSLSATPVINLFEKRADRVPVSDAMFEHQLVVDRSRAQDFEVFQVKQLQGIVSDQKESIEFLPFYAGFDSHSRSGHSAFFTTRREPTGLSERQLRQGTRTGYVGSEVFLSIVDTKDAPYALKLEQLAPEVLATNRDLPLLLPMGDLIRLQCETVGGLESIALLAGFSRPRPSIAEAEQPWRLISHLGLNYLSLFDAAQGSSAEAMKALLRLYCQLGDQSAERQIESIRRIDTKPIVRRLPIDGPIAFGRGLEVSLHVDETGFAGASAFLFASMLERVIAQHVGVNTFAQTVLRTDNRGEVKKWPPRSGNRVIA